MRLPKGVINKSVWANGHITRYHLVCGWFIDRGLGPHKNRCFRYQIFEPGASEHGSALSRGGNNKLVDAIKKAEELYATK